MHRKQSRIGVTHSVPCLPHCAWPQTLGLIACAVSFDTLLAYETERQRHTVPFLLAIEGLVALYRFNWGPAVAARSVGLQILDACTAIKVCGD